MDTEFHERLTRVETQLAAVTATVDTTAADVREIRDHMLTAKGRRVGAGKVLAIIGALVTTAATVGLGINAVAAMIFHR